MKHYDFNINEVDDDIYVFDLALNEALNNDNIFKKIWNWIKNLFKSRHKTSYGYYDFPTTSSIQLGDKTVETTIENGKKAKSKVVELKFKDDIDTFIESNEFKDGLAFPNTKKNNDKGLYKSDTCSLFIITATEGNYDVVAITSYKIDNKEDGYGYLLSMEFNQQVEVTDINRLYEGVLYYIKKIYANNYHKCWIIKEKDERLYKLVQNEKNKYLEVIEQSKATQMINNINKNDSQKKDDEKDNNKEDDKKDDKKDDENIENDNNKEDDKNDDNKEDVKNKDEHNKEDEESKEESIKDKLIKFYNANKDNLTTIKNSIQPLIQQSERENNQIIIQYNDKKCIVDSDSDDAKIISELTDMFNDVIKDINSLEADDKKDTDIQNLIKKLNTLKIVELTEINESNNFLNNSYKSLYLYIKEGLDDENILWLIDKWFEGKNDDNEAFMSLINSCIVNKNTSKEYIEKETQNTVFTENYLKEFINFVHNDVNIKIEEPYYQLSKIIQYLINNKSIKNKYIK